MSARRNASGHIEPLSPIASPQVIFKSLFAGGVANSMGNDLDPALALAQARHQSVLDLVGTRAKDLMNRLGTSDRNRLQQHLDEIRDLERSVGTIAPTSSASCNALKDPGPDAASNVLIETGGTGRTVGYADELRRADVLTEMLYLALACDMTRAASLMITFAQCFMNAAPLLGGLAKGAQLDVHEAGHTALLGAETMQDIMSRCLAWHVDVFARVVRRLKDTPDGDGTLLDHTALTLMFEGGMGKDPETGEQGVTHSSENMCALYAGGGLRGGTHVDGGKAHPGRVLVSAMRAVKVDDALGDLKDPLPGLA